MERSPDIIDQSSSDASHVLMDRGSRGLAWRTTKRLLRSEERVVALVLTAIVFIFTYDWQLFTDHPPFADHLGGEYYNIAVALVAGRGYSDPFAGLTGTTAWMPPLFSFLLAGLLLILKTKALVAKAVVLLTGISWITVGLILFRIAKRCRTTIPPVVIVGLFTGWLWAYYSWFFMMTHDIWLIGLLLSLIALAFSRYAATGRLNRLRWGMLGGLATLTSPAVTFAWFGLCLYVLWRAREQRRGLLTALAVAAALSAPWVARNALVFHRFIPAKSNAFYEAYQANYQDDDGIYDGTFLNHPYNSVMTRYDYAQRGEMAFIAQHEDLFLGSLRRDPKRYARAVFNRLLAVTVEYVPSKNAQETKTQSIFRRIIYPLPFLMLVACVSLRGSGRRFVSGMGILFALYLLPYVFVAFYLRYMMPLTPLLILFTFIGLDRIAAAFMSARSFAGFAQARNTTVKLKHRR